MNETSSELIYQKLREQLLYNRYDSTQFLTERDIASEFGVSRTPVRNALQRLFQEGYIVSYPRKGYMLRRVDIVHIFQIQQIRFQLESLSIALIIKTASDEELEHFTPPVVEKDSTNPYHTANSLFHSQLALLSHNDPLARTIHQHLGDCSLAVFQHPELIQNWSNFHEEILDAIRKRDFPASQEYLAKDLQLKHYTQSEALLPL